MFRLNLYLILIAFLPVWTSAQQYELKGIVVNGKTGDPIENVNVVIRQSPTGTATDKEGKFRLEYKSLPVTVDFTYIGFEPITIDVTKNIPGTVEISLQPAIQNLDGIIITVSKVIPIYQDHSYSVIDYEFMGDNILVLVYRYRWRNTELLLLTRWGDTLATSVLPDLPPSRLYKDPLGYVHYFSKNGNAYQCYYNKAERMVQFIYRNSVDTVLKTFATLQFVMNKWLFFHEESSGGFSSKVGYIDNKNGKKYLQLADNQKQANDYYSDLNSFLEPRRPDDTFLTEANMQAFELFFKPKCNSSVVKAGPGRVAIFNFTTDSLLVYDSDLKVLSGSVFSFHKEQPAVGINAFFTAFSGNTWKWRWNIYPDEFTGKVYTDYERHGSKKLCEIDLETGKLLNEIVLPVLFAQKIIVYKGEAFFLYKPIGESEKWKLYKMQL